MNRTLFLRAALAASLGPVLTACAPVPGHDRLASPPVPSAQAHGESGASPAPRPADPDLARAQAAATAFGGRLRAALQAAMQAGGPTAAVEVCQAEAPAIATAVMATHGVRLGRVALPGRHRNPGQAAGGWQLAALDAFQRAVEDGAPAGEQVAVLRTDLPDGVALRMVRGIATEPACLACHGGQVAPAVRRAIAAHYPDDAATGFAVGDLRGALWVEVPTAPAPSFPPEDAP